MWLAPNLITLSGLICLFFAYAGMWYYAPEFVGGCAGTTHTHAHACGCLWRYGMALGDEPFRMQLYVLGGDFVWGCGRPELLASPACSALNAYAHASHCVPCARPISDDRCMQMPMCSVRVHATPLPSFQARRRGGPTC